MDDQDRGGFQSESASEAPSGEATHSQLKKTPSIDALIDKSIIENADIYANTDSMDTVKLLKQIEGALKDANDETLVKVARVVFNGDPDMLAELPKKKAATLPTNKPKWQDRKNPDRDPEDRKLKPPYYIQKYYGEFLDGKTVRSALNKDGVDKPLYFALNNWLKDNDMPADVNLPTKKQDNDRKVADFDRGMAKTLPADEFKRLEDAARYRQLVA